ncbi:MBOAT family protein [Lyngbya sp. PCC 8106]|uniref:MBOAT family O-acyltransferase n=1 Tax=Lyngbya sp. (strain PCC 8106) TaxID=313612 RepID=UPI0000EAA366|nr:MBOAT family O-acyltransferase [Lyngbya sp. PCC 8106]EAW37741.1 alginate o-acetyltransferase [Lyngbya sp. PCC 8106]
MTFISVPYALFLLILFGVYWIVPWQSWRMLTLLVASLFFYATLQIQYIPLLILYILFNFGLALAIGEPLDWRIANEAWNSRRLILLWIGIIFNVFLLLGFKYLPFIFNTVGETLKLPLFLDRATWLDNNLIAPLGLSFFCFEIIAYLIDVYRGAPAANSFLTFTSYKLFFPKLISGPITRYHNLEYQLKNLKFPIPEQIADGLWLIARGAVKKGLFADRIGILVDLSFSSLERAGSGDLWLATFAYGLQLYLDFSGYIDLARGSALLLGLSLPENFDAPYFTTSIADFWRRWHMTLGDWLRNYLYFPLGGSRVGLLHTCLNLLIVMLIAGIWHGAAWGFIVWGILHGMALVIHRLTDTLSKQFSIQEVWKTFPGIIFSWFLTQSMVFFAWIFFRLPNLKDSEFVMKNLWNHPADVQFAHKVYVESLSLERINVVFLLVSVFVLMGLSTLFNRGLKLQLSWPIKLVLAPICFLAVWLLAPEGVLPYIYFDF